MADPAVTQVDFYASKAFGKFSRTAEPTLEGQNAVDSLGDAIATTEQAIDVLDTQRKTRIVIDDNGESATFRFDLALTDLIKADFAVIDNHTIRTAYPESVLSLIDVYHDTNAAFNGSTLLVPSKSYSGLINKGRPYLKFDGIDDYVSKAGLGAELMPNVVDRDFSGASAWTDEDLDGYNETDDLTILAGLSGQYCYLPVASAPMTAGDRYRLEFDVANIASTWYIKDFTGAQIFGTVTANGTDQFIDFTVSPGLTGGLRIVSVDNDSAGDFDNFSLKKINRDLNFGANTDFALEAIFRTSKDYSAAEGKLINKGAGMGGATAYYRMHVRTGNTLGIAIRDGSTGKTAAVTGAVNDGKWYHGIATFDRNGNVIVYRNAIAGTPADISAVGDVDDVSEPLQIGIRDAVEMLDGDIALIRIWNRAPSAAEVATLLAGWTHTPIPAVDQGADQTPDNVNNCENGTQAYDTFEDESATGFHAVKTTTGAGVTKCATADEISFVLGQKYNVGFTATLTSGVAPKFDLKNTKATSATKSDEGEQTVVAGSNFFTFTANATLTGVVQFNNLTGDQSEFTIADLLVSASGCVLEYHPHGINPDESTWYDTYANNLDGTITGATEKDCPTAINGEGDFTLIEFTEVEKQYWFFQINLDGNTADADTLFGQIGIGKKFTPSTRPDLNVLKRDGFGIDGTETHGGRRSSDKRHDKRRRWQLSWSYVDQDEMDDFQDFFDLIEVGDVWSYYPFWFSLNGDAKEPIFYWGRIIGIPEVRELTFEAYAISVILETEV